MYETRVRPPIDAGPPCTSRRALMPTHSSTTTSSATRRILAAACTLALGTAGALHLVGGRTASDSAVPLAFGGESVAHVPTARAADQLEGRQDGRIGAETATRARPLEASRSRLLAARRAGAMPIGNLRGWRQVLAEDFRGTTLPRGWDRYDGQPGGNPHGWWDASHATLRGHDLHLVGDWQNGTFVTGGVMATGFASTYGKYEVRFKVARAAGVAYTLLLWPASENWPVGGEIDFAEDGGGARRGTTATLHYGAANNQVQHELRADFTHFQTVGVEWTPGRITYTLNGRPWAAVVGAAVPTGPMRLALQLEAGRGASWSPAPSRATPRTVDMDIDWVVGYRRT